MINSIIDEKTNRKSIKRLILSFGRALKAISAPSSPIEKTAANRNTYIFLVIKLIHIRISSVLVFRICFMICQLIIPKINEEVLTMNCSLNDIVVKKLKIMPNSDISESIKRYRNEIYITLEIIFLLLKAIMTTGIMYMAPVRQIPGTYGQSTT